MSGKRTEKKRERLPALVTGYACMLIVLFCIVMFLYKKEQCYGIAMQKHYQVQDFSVKQLGTSYGDIVVDEGWILYAVEWTMTNQSNQTLFGSSARLYYDLDVGWANPHSPGEAASEIGYGNQYVVPGGLTGKVYELLEVPARATKLLVYDSPDREEPVAELPLR